MNSAIDKKANIVKCIPQKGDWAGGDEVVIIMSEPIKRKGFFSIILSLELNNFMFYFHISEQCFFRFWSTWTASYQ